MESNLKPIMRIGYHHAYILTMDDKWTAYPSGWLVIEGTKIVAMGEMASFDEGTAERWVDAEGGILMPGFINAHTHCGMIPFRSLGDDVPDRLRRFLFPLEQSVVDAALIKASSRYAMGEMALAGVTTFCDMYYHESVVAEAADESHMRAFVGETIIDMQTPDSPTSQESLTYTKKFLQQWQHVPLVTPMIAPHAPNTNDEETLQAILALAQEYQAPITMHVAEMTYEMDEFQEKYRITPVAYLEKLGYLDQRLIMAHGILLTDEDIDILAQHPTVSIVHCIGANTKSAKGVAPIQKLLEKGVTVALGTDGPSSGNTLDLFTQMRMMANFHKTTLADRTAFPSREIVALATRGGAKALGIDKEVGSLEAGKQADMILIETKSMNMFPIFDPYAVLVYSAFASNVQDVYVAGRAIVLNKQLQEFSIGKLREALSNSMVAFSREALLRQQSL